MPGDPATELRGASRRGDGQAGGSRREEHGAGTAAPRRQDPPPAALPQDGGLGPGQEGPQDRRVRPADGPLPLANLSLNESGYTSENT